MALPIYQMVPIQEVTESPVAVVLTQPPATAAHNLMVVPGVAYGVQNLSDIDDLVVESAFAATDNYDDFGIKWAADRDHDFTIPSGDHGAYWFGIAPQGCWLSNGTIGANTVGPFMARVVGFSHTTCRVCALKLPPELYQKAFCGEAWDLPRTRITDIWESPCLRANSTNALVAKRLVFGAGRNPIWFAMNPNAVAETLVFHREKSYTYHFPKMGAVTIASKTVSIPGDSLAYCFAIPTGYTWEQEGDGAECLAGVPFVCPNLNDLTRMTGWTNHDSQIVYDVPSPGAIPTISRTAGGSASLTFEQTPTTPYALNTDRAFVARIVVDSLTYGNILVSCGAANGEAVTISAAGTYEIPFKARTSGPGVFSICVDDPDCAFTISSISLMRRSQPGCICVENTTPGSGVFLSRLDNEL